MTKPFRYHIPNILTILRILAVPGVILLILDDRLLTACGVFALASITDFVDGYLARRWKVESTVGRLLDPLADKSLLICCFLTLGYKGFLPLWVVTLVISRDILIILAGISVYLFKIPMMLRPSWASKINTVTQILLVGGTLMLQGSLFYAEYSFLSTFIIPFLQGGMFVILWLTGIMTVWSGGEYGLDFGRQVMARLKSPR